jgi:flagellar protein FliO/FliZ
MPHHGTSDVLGKDMELSEIFRFVASLAFILGLIGLCAYVAKRMGLATGGIAATGTQKRLSIVEVKVVDAKHRLILMRRDDREHLILLGGENDLLIESGIEAPAMPEQKTDLPSASASPLPQFQKIVEFIRERRA